MPVKIFGPRKRRTRQHVIADQSVHYVEGFILDEGHTAQRVYSDYGYDLVMYTFDKLGYCEPGLVSLQVKAAEQWDEEQSSCIFDLDIRDFNLWMRERLPVILILFDASGKRACWVCIQEFFREETRRPVRGVKTIRIRVPMAQRWSRRAVGAVRRLKMAAVSDDERGTTYAKDRCDLRPNGSGVAFARFFSPRHENETRGGPV